jgi:hypothetical protein
MVMIYVPSLGPELGGPADGATTVLAFQYLVNVDLAAVAERSILRPPRLHEPWLLLTLLVEFAGMPIEAVPTETGRAASGEVGYRQVGVMCRTPSLLDVTADRNYVRLPARRSGPAGLSHLRDVERDATIVRTESVCRVEMARQPPTLWAGVCKKDACARYTARPGPASCGLPAIHAGP